VRLFQPNAITATSQLHLGKAGVIWRSTWWCAEFGLPGFTDGLFPIKNKTTWVPASISCLRKSCETSARTAGFCYLTWNTLCKTDPGGTEVHTFPNLPKKVLIENSSEMTL